MLSVGNENKNVIGGSDVSTNKTLSVNNADKKKEDTTNEINHEISHGTTVNSDDGDKDKKKKGDAALPVNSINQSIPFPFPKQDEKNKDNFSGDQKSKFAPANGDEAGTLKGIKSGVIQDKPKLFPPSMDVKFEGKGPGKIINDNNKVDDKNGDLQKNKINDSKEGIIDKSISDKKPDENVIENNQEEVELELKEENKDDEKTLVVEKLPELTRTPEIKVDTASLKKDAELQKKLLKAAVVKEEQKLTVNANRHKKTVDKEYTKQTGTVTLDYDSAIARVRQSLKTAQARVVIGKGEKRALLVNNAADRKAQVDIITTAKQNELILLGKQYGIDAKSHAAGLINDAAKRYEKGKTTVEKNAADAIAPYVKHEYYADVKTDVNEAATETKKNLIKSTYDLQVTLKEDANDIAGQFDEDAATAASKMPDSKDATKKNIANILVEGLKQFDGVSGKPLLELATRVSQTVAELQKNKKEALDNLRKQKDDADKKINEKETEGKKALRSQNDKLVNAIDTITGDTEKEIKILKPELGNKLIDAAKEKLKETSSILAESSVSINKSINQQQSGIASSTVSSLIFTGKESSKNADTIAGNAEKGGKQTSDSMIDSYAQVSTQMTDSMDAELVNFTTELDNTITECRTKFDEQLAEGIKGMNEKANDVFAENNKMVADSRQQFIDQAKDSSEVGFWDFMEALGSFFLGVLKAIGMILLVLAIILVIVGLLILLFYGIVFLIGYFGAAGLALLLLDMGAIFGAYLLELLAAYWIHFLVIGVVVSIKMYYDKSQDKNLTRNQKWEGYGEATTYLLTSFLGSWSSFKGLFGAAAEVADAEAAVLNIAKEEIALTNVAKEELAITNIAKEEMAVTNIAKEEAGMV
ncbi:MAG: DUF4150 domain-containing protein, partial [Bacteroidota bacterium]|nr:DUF4150 domain-containing protein [Bacteroidota bacterium]